MRCERFGIIVLFLAFLFFCLQDAGAQELLSQQSSSIRDSLVSIREQSIALSEELMNVQQKLTVSEAERTDWENKSTELSKSLTTINRQLNDSYESIIALKTKLKIVTAILLVLALMKTAGFALYFIGIKVPRGLDILL